MPVENEYFIIYKVHMVVNIKITILWIVGS
jgi:hypothetical protein